MARQSFGIKFTATQHFVRSNGNSGSHSSFDEVLELIFVRVHGLDDLIGGNDRTSCANGKFSIFFEA
jgi:hypothetical protein